jgi:CubicO group peptidase (beta-lactamase class C family)
VTMTIDLGHRLVNCAVALALTIAMLTSCSGSPGRTASSSRPAASSSSGDVPVSHELVTRLAEGLPRDLPVFLGSVQAPSFVGLRAALVQVDGRTVFEEYYGGSSASDTNDVFSVTKSVLSTLVGIALDEGAIRSVQQTLGELLPEHASEMRPEVAAITLRQLLTMTAGLEGNSVGNPPLGVFSGNDWVGNILRAGQAGPPGQFDYANSGSHLLAAILARATGGSVLDYAQRKLFAPLGIDTQPAFEPVVVEENLPAYEKAGFAWPVDPSGLQVGFALLKIRPRDMAKLGALYLNDGTWHGKRVLSSAYIRDATKGQVPATGATTLYGYQWWVSIVGKRHAAYAAVGFGGQLIEVVPSLRLVAVFSTHVGDTETGGDGRAYLNIMSTLVEKVESP